MFWEEEEEEKKKSRKQKSKNSHQNGSVMTGRASSYSHGAYSASLCCFRFRRLLCCLCFRLILFVVILQLLLRNAVASPTSRPRTEFLMHWPGGSGTDVWSPCGSCGGAPLAALCSGDACLHEHLVAHLSCIVVAKSAAARYTARATPARRTISSIGRRKCWSVVLGSICGCCGCCFCSPRQAVVS